MSNTYKTTKARTARHLARNQISDFNAKTGDFNQVRGEINALAVNGERYGNQRKSQAQGKVIIRRVERRRANRAVSLEDN